MGLWGYGVMEWGAAARTAGTLPARPAGGRNPPPSPAPSAPRTRSRRADGDARELRAVQGPCTAVDGQSPALHHDRVPVARGEHGVFGDGGGVAHERPRGGSGTLGMWMSSSPNAETTHSPSLRRHSTNTGELAAAPDGRSGCRARAATGPRCISVCIPNRPSNGPNSPPPRSNDEHTGPPAPIPRTVSAPGNRQMPVRGAPPCSSRSVYTTSSRRAAERTRPARRSAPAVSRAATPASAHRAWRRMPPSAPPSAPRRPARKPAPRWESVASG
jgi:hypothetical protein